MNDKITVELTKEQLMKTIASLFLSQVSRGVKDEEIDGIISDLTLIALTHISEDEIKEMNAKLLSKMNK
jgi:hypothetical protein